MGLHDAYLNLQLALQQYATPQELHKHIAELKAFFSGGARDEIYQLFHPGIRHPINLRRKTSDFNNFVQIFVRAEYSPCFPYVPQVIVDLGSYVGLSAIYFANRFPDAKIICVEPSVDNFEILRMNARPYKNISIVNAGVWSHKTKIKLARQVGGDWGNIFEESTDADAIETVSIDSLIDDFGLKKIDFLKIDIEGSEKQLFSKNTERWRAIVNSVACETHDRFVEGCAEAYDRLFADEFVPNKSGEFKAYMRKQFSLIDKVRL